MPQRATLNTDWHGVPAGTALIVHDISPDIQGTQIAKVEREDGADLPGPFDKGPRGWIAAEFLTLGENLAETERGN